MKSKEENKKLFLAPIILDPLARDIVYYDVDRDGKENEVRRESVRINYYINKLKKTS